MCAKKHHSCPGSSGAAKGGGEWGGLVPPTFVQAHFCKSCKSVEFFGGIRDELTWTSSWPLSFPVFETRASVASYEHSKVKILNNYLRSSRSSDRLEYLVQVSSERRIVDTMELEKLVDVFKLKSQRRIKLEIVYCHCFMRFRFLFHILLLCQCHCFLTFSGFFNFCFHSSL